MTTRGGLVITKVEIGTPLTYITLSGFHEGKKTHRIGYFQDQQLEVTTTEGVKPMAQRVNVIVTSDLFDKADASTVTFGLDGKTYEIDLTSSEAGELRKALTKYVAVARPVKGKRRSPGKAANGATPAEIRAWAQENGHEVPERGRIPAEAREAYDKAHPDAA